MRSTLRDNPGQLKLVDQAGKYPNPKELNWVICILRVSPLSSAEETEVNPAQLSAAYAIIIKLVVL